MTEGEVAASPIPNWFECPSSRGPLTWKDGQLFSENIGRGFPSSAGIPWLFRHPEAQISQWQARALEAQEQNKLRLGSLNEERRSRHSLLSTTKTRLELIDKALTHNGGVFAEILRELTPDDGRTTQSGPHPGVIGLTDRLAAHQTLTTYYQNIFRDWAWENGENEASIEILSSLLPKPEADTLWLVLGAGAGRLAYDLARQQAATATVFAIDINPFFLLTLKRLLKGEKIGLYELPRAPLTINDAAVLRTLAAPAATPTNLHLLFADAMNLPVKAAAASVVVTPWLIDILPQDFRDFARRMNRTLSPSGVWLNFGPLGFQQAAEGNAYSREEILAILTESGFEVTDDKIAPLPYLQSPAGGQRRTERVLCFRATKVRSVAEPKYFEILPDWLLNHQQPIPRENEWAEMHQRFLIQGDILATIDGVRSVDDIVKLMQTHYGMTEPMARGALLSFLTRLVEATQRRPI